MSVQNSEVVLPIIDKLAEYCLNKPFPVGNVRSYIVELGKSLRENEPRDAVEAAFKKVWDVKDTKVWREDSQRKNCGKFEYDTTLQGYFKEIMDWGDAIGFIPEPNEIDGL